MSAPWFRVPIWCYNIHNQQSADRARAWVYLLGAWHAGDNPSTREVRRVTGFGGGRVVALISEVREWATLNGASCPVLTTQVTGQERGATGAVAGQPDQAATPELDEERGATGAVAGQERGASRARVPFGERCREREETQTAPDGACEGGPEPVATTPSPDAPPVAPPTPKPTRGLTEAESAVWAVWRGYHPRGAPTPPAPQAKAIVAAAKAIGADRAALVVAWAHEAPHHRATYLRGDGYAPGKTGAYLDPVSLFRATTLAERDGWAAEWGEAGRPHYSTAAPEVRQGRPQDDPRFAKVEARLREVVRTQGDPDKCAEPAKARGLLRVLVELGGDPVVMSRMSGPEANFAIRDWVGRLLAHADRRQEVASG